MKKQRKWFMGLVAAVMSLGLMLSGVPVSAWGPERPTYTMAHPAEKAVFNSITDNAAIGDERDFVRIAEVDSGKAFTSELIIEPDKDYIVMIYYHNDASATFNDVAHNRVGFAENVRMSSFFPSKLDKGERGKVDGVITASNTDPASVWDEAYITAREAVTLEYIEGSAVIRNQKGSDGTLLSAALFTNEGVLLGTNSLNGLVPGCDEYAGQVFYRFHTTGITVEPEDPETPEEPDVPVVPDEPTPEVPEELPTTGPAEVALAVVIILAIAAGGFYWYKTHKAVKKLPSMPKVGNKRK